MTVTICDIIIQIFLGGVIVVIIMPITTDTDLFIIGKLKLH